MYSATWHKCGIWCHSYNFVVSIGKLKPVQERLSVMYSYVTAIRIQANVVIMATTVPRPHVKSSYQNFPPKSEMDQ